VNAEQVRAAVAAQVEASIVSRNQGRDRLRHVEMSQRDTQMLPERAFKLSLLGPPQRLDYSQCVAYRVEYDCEVFYTAAAGIQDRIADDAQAITKSVYSIHTQSADLWSGDAVAQSPTELDGNVILPVSIVVKYRSN